MFDKTCLTTGLDAYSSNSFCTGLFHAELLNEHLYTTPYQIPLVISSQLVLEKL